MNPQKTTVDWLTFRAQAEPRDVLEALRPALGAAGTALSFKALQRGALGFQQAGQIVLEDMPIARLDYGGDSQRGWTRTCLSGSSCEWLDWDTIGAIEDLPRAEIRRLDLALTTWDGEITYEMVLAAHAAGRFASGGRPPNLEQRLNSNPLLGSTANVGKRKSDKFFRGYKKGLEMVQKHRMPEGVTHIDGHAVENIFRCELELKSKTAPIGFEVIERRDQYFAGAYPFCADVLPGVEADILMRRKERAPQTSLAVGLENARIQFGNLLFTALHAYHGDMGAVWVKIIGKKHCQALVEAGVLLVEHE